MKLIMHTYVQALDWLSDVPSIFTQITRMICLIVLVL